MTNWVAHEPLEHTRESIYNFSVSYKSQILSSLILNQTYNPGVSPWNV